MTGRTEPSAKIALVNDTFSSASGEKIVVSVVGGVECDIEAESGVIIEQFEPDMPAGLPSASVITTFSYIPKRFVGDFFDEGPQTREAPQIQDGARGGATLDYVTVTLTDGGHIVGFALIEIEDDGLETAKARFLCRAMFPKKNGDYQNITEYYVERRVIEEKELSRRRHEAEDVTGTTGVRQ